MFRSDQKTIKPRKNLIKILFWLQIAVSMKLQFWAKLSFWLNFYGTLFSFDHYESCTFLSYFCKTSVLKKISVLSSFWKNSRIRAKNSYIFKTAIFAICKKLIIWNKNIELYMINNQIWYDLEDWFKCFWNFRTCSLIYGHTVLLSGNRRSGIWTSIDISH